MARHIHQVGIIVLAGFVSIGCAGKSDQQAMSDMPAPTPAASVQIAGVDRTQAATAEVRGLRDMLASEKANITKSMTALDSVMAGQGDLVPALQAYTAALADSRIARDRVNAQVEVMRGKVRDYVSGWEAEIYGVDDPALRQQAETRRGQVRQNFTAVNERLKGAREAYEAFNTAASDLQRFLANDLTRAGVAAGAQSAQKTRDAARALEGQIDAAIAELERVGGEMTPSGPATRTAAR